ncbi:hypothetical protein V2J09_013367 [Rumex salicifolius]
MVRTAKPPYSNNHPEEDEDGEELPPETMDASSNRDGHSSEQKSNSSRSKHSETEQRRRSKINERKLLVEETLKDLIPPNDQRRDKASLLLEVIEYIRFLHDRIQLFEGSCQGWGQETTKLIPWRNSHGLGDGYSDHSQFMNNGCAHDNNFVQSISNIQSIVPSDFGGNAYEGAEHVSEPASSVPSNMSPLPMIYSRRCILPAEDLASQPELQVWRGKSSIVECTTTSNTMSPQDRTQESCLSNISNAYSQGLLKTLTEALQTSGVDLSQANISVQLEAGKRKNSNHTLSSSAPETNIETVLVFPLTRVNLLWSQLTGKGSSSSQIHYREESAEDPNQDAKRLRAE